MSEDALENAVGPGKTDPSIRQAVEIAIRLGSIGLLVIGCLAIIAPFVGIVIWALIIAIAADGLHGKLTGSLGGRRGLAAALVVLALLLLVIGPAVGFSATLVSGAQRFSHEIREGTVKVPPPADSVKDWPVVGERVHRAWSLASQNLAAAAEQARPQLEAASRALLGAAGNAGAGILQLMASIVIAGFMLARSEARRRSIDRFASRMAGPERGPELADLSRATVRSVVQGILGVALIQAILAGAGLAVAGIPAAGLWALFVLVAAIVQLPSIVVLIVPIVQGFSMLDPLWAVVLTVWLLAVGSLDNVLKPILFGRGVSVPSLVIFMGAIGGMLSMGIVGLFLGAVVLAVGFALFMAWLSDADAAPAEEPGSAPA